MKKIAAFTLSFLLATPYIAQAAERVSIVELFTSQGCSSCPPADAFLGQLSKRDDVLALAYHVDYWDYIGWDDVHAQAAFTKRQRAYAQAFNLRYVYTPQMVIGGARETSGNKQGDVLHAIAKDLSQPVQIKLSQNTDNQFSLSGPKQAAPLSVYLVRYQKQSTTEVRRGENRGKSLTDYNIVTSLEKIGTWTGGEEKFFTSQKKDNTLGEGIFLQREGDLRVAAAFKID